MKSTHFECKNPESPISAVNISISRSGETNMQLMCSDQKAFNNIIKLFLNAKLLFIHKDSNNHSINIKGTLYSYKCHEKVYYPENMCIKALEHLLDHNISPVFLNKILTNFPDYRHNVQETTPATQSSLTKSSMFNENDFVHIENDDVKDYDSSATTNTCRIS